MGQAIGDILPLAIGVAISPADHRHHPHARDSACAHDGTVFALGWVAGLTIVGTVMLVVATGNATSAGEPATWASTLKLVLGAKLLGDAIIGLST